MLELLWDEWRRTPPSSGTVGPLVRTDRDLLFLEALLNKPSRQPTRQDGTANTEAQ